MSNRRRSLRASRVATRSVAASGSIMKVTWLATVTLLSGGCVTTPTHPESPAVSASSSGTIGSSETSNAVLAAQTNPKTDFHKSATERQRFQVHMDFGRVFEAQGNFDAAILEYQDAMAVVVARKQGQLKPVDEALAHRRMGGALDQLGRFAQAEVHYKKALKLSPKDARIWNDAGYSFYLQGRWAEAEGALKTAAKFAPDDERIRTNLGLTLAALGRTEEALPLLSRTTGDANGHLNLGYSLAATGQFSLARQQYEVALSMRPDLDLARRALAQLDRQQGSTAGAETGTLMARSARTTRPAVVDPGVNPASTATVRPSPSMPARAIPQPKPPAWLDPPASQPSVSGKTGAGLLLQPPALPNPPNS
jgi:Flp pilus assembly protein TadD